MDGWEGAGPTLLLLAVHIETGLFIYLLPFVANCIGLQLTLIYVF